MKVYLGIGPQYSRQFDEYLNEEITGWFQELFELDSIDMDVYIERESFYEGYGVELKSVEFDDLEECPQLAAIDELESCLKGLDLPDDLFTTVDNAIDQTKSHIENRIDRAIELFTSDVLDALVKYVLENWHIDLLYNQDYRDEVNALLSLNQEQAMERALEIYE